MHAIDWGRNSQCAVPPRNSDPTEIADEITNLFPDDSRQKIASRRCHERFQPFGGAAFRGLVAGVEVAGGGGGGGNAGAASQNQRIKKRNRVIAVADQRTRRSS